MLGPTPSGTNVVSSGCSPSKAVGTRAMGSTVQQRKKCQLWNPACRLYHICRDLRDVAILNRRFPGLKVGPVPALVMSLLFIASVFMLHIWGKYTRL